jgi:hypothetical protein
VKYVLPLSEAHEDALTGKTDLIIRFASCAAFLRVMDQAMVTIEPTSTVSTLGCTDRAMHWWITYDTLQRWFGGLAATVRGFGICGISNFQVSDGWCPNQGTLSVIAWNDDLLSKYINRG